MKLTVGIRLESADFDRLNEMAKKEDRTMSQMGRILLVEALNERECSAAIREAFGGEGDE